VARLEIAQDQFQFDFRHLFVERENGIDDPSDATRPARRRARLDRDVEWPHDHAGRIGRKPQWMVDYVEQTDTPAAVVEGPTGIPPAQSLYSGTRPARKALFDSKSPQICYLTMPVRLCAGAASELAAAFVIAVQTNWKARIDSAPWFRLTRSLIKPS
jgi:hypothetical protein